jgi:IS30 family transposase
MRHFSEEQRMTLEILWNVNANRGRDTRLSVHAFAREHGFPYATMRRELRRGMEGETLLDRRKGEWFYPERSATRAQADADDRNARKGTGMAFTNVLAAAFRRHIPDLGKSPAHARHDIVAEGLHARVPCAGSVRNHIEHGDIGVLRGQTPRRPSAKRKRKRPVRRSRKCLANLSIEERPQAANDRTEFGHWEMDTVVSRVGGRGGLLVLVERKTRFQLIVRLRRPAAKAVRNALRSLIRSGAFKRVRSITTDNGCEFLDSEALECLFRDVNATLKIYRTHAYAAWEKGAVENANRHIRRFHPKGTDFSRVTDADILRTQNFINSIPRFHSLKGQTAHEAFNAVA